MSDILGILAASEEEDDERRRYYRIARNNADVTPPAVPPLFASAEIGTVDASTVAVTFDQAVTASDYAAGVTIKVNTVAATITSAARQTDHAVVYYVLDAPAANGDTVTWEYLQVSGNILAEDDNTPLADVTAQSVTNNIPLALPQVASATLLSRTETIGSNVESMNDSDPAGLWSDQSGNGHDFTQTGSARPTKQTIDGYPAVVFDGIDDWMLGDSFADNLDAFSVFMVYKYSPGTLGEIILSKASDFLISANAGWGVYQDMHFGLQNEGSSSYSFTALDTPLGTSAFHVIEHHAPNKNSVSIYVDGSIRPQTFSGSSDLSNYSSSEPVRLMSDGVPESSGHGAGPLRAILIYQITDLVNWATDRAAITAWLAARYGITL